MPLLNLPNEVLLTIFEKLNEQKDISSLSRTCWRLFHASVPSLYRHNHLRDDGSAIAWAVRENRVATIRRALDTGVDLLRVNHLRLAVKLGHRSLFAMLWEHKAERGGFSNLDEIENGKRLLHIATAHGEYDIVKTLLATGRVDIDAPDDAPHSPLYIAAHDGSHDLVKLFLEHGANVMGRGSSGRVPLSIAAGHNSAHCGRAHHVTNGREGFLETARHLLRYGAQIEHTDNKGRTALYDAATAGHCHMVELLASHGATLTVREPRFGNTVLHTTSLYLGRLDMAELLVRLGADVTATNNRGQNALWMTSNLKEPAQVAEFLLQSGARMDPDNDGNTPLHSAVISESLELIEVLLIHGADANAANHSHETPFHHAVDGAQFSGSNEIIKLMIQHGADVTIKRWNGPEVLVSAMGWADPDIIRLLLENGADPNCINKYGGCMLHEAIARGSQEVINLVIEYGGYEAFFERGGEGRFHRGAITEDLALMQSVSDLGASINETDESDQTALVVAVVVGATKSVDWLLAKGARVNVPDSSGRTALHHATEKGAASTVKTLLEHGANVHKIDSRKLTPLHLAAMGGKIDIVRMLLDSGANIRARDGYGKTPERLASRHRHRDIVDLLNEEAEKPQASGYRRMIEVASFWWGELTVYFS